MQSNIFLLIVASLNAEIVHFFELIVQY